MALAGVQLFNHHPAYQVWETAIEGLADCYVKNLKSSQKTWLIALPLFLTLGAATSTILAFPFTVSATLGLGAIAALAYTIYRFVLSQNHRSLERALIGMVKGDYVSASSHFKAMLKPEFAAITEARLKQRNAERLEKKLPQEHFPDMFLADCRRNFEFRHIRTDHDLKLFGKLYGCTLLFKLCQELKSGCATAVADELEQAKFWLRWQWGQIAPWQAELIANISAAATTGLKTISVPHTPSSNRLGAVALLSVIERLQHYQSSTWKGIWHTKSFLNSLKPFINASVGTPGHQLFQELLRCPSREEMQRIALGFPQAEIETLERLALLD